MNKIILNEGLNPPQTVLPNTEKKEYNSPKTSQEKIKIPSSQNPQK